MVILYEKLHQPFDPALASFQRRGRNSCVYNLNVLPICRLFTGMHPIN